MNQVYRFTSHSQVSRRTGGHHSAQMRFFQREAPDRQLYMFFIALSGSSMSSVTFEAIDIPFTNYNLLSQREGQRRIATSD